jgi:predicted transcriptional regulator
MKNEISKQTSSKSEIVRKLPKATQAKGNKQVAIKARTLVDQETGEVISTTEIESKATDINFHKIFIAHIIEALDSIGNQKIKLLTFLLAHKNNDNQIIMTQRDMAKKSEISLKTVSTTLKVLIQHDFIIKQSASVYLINPNMLFKGSGQKRMSILLTYTETQADKKIINETKISEEPDTYIQTEEKE